MKEITLTQNHLVYSSQELSESFLKDCKEFAEHVSSHKLERRYKALLASAKERKLLVKLNFKSYSKIVENPCYYCDGVLSETGYNIDRLDSSKGYTWENSVACCSGCNRLKSNIHSPETTLRLVQTLKELHGNDIWNSLSKMSWKGQKIENKEVEFGKTYIYAVTTHKQDDLKLAKFAESYIEYLVDQQLITNSYIFKKKGFGIETDHVTTKDVADALTANVPESLISVYVMDKSPNDLGFKVLTDPGRLIIRPKITMYETTVARHYRVEYKKKTLHRIPQDIRQSIDSAGIQLLSQPLPETPIY